MTFALLLTLLLAPPPAAAARLDVLGQIADLEDRRTLGGGSLLAHLGSPEAGLRRRAALAVGRVGDPAGVPRLSSLLSDDVTEVRQMAAFALGLLGDRSAVDPLLSALADPQPVVRARAAEALGQIGDPRAAPEVARLVVQSGPKGTLPVSVRGDDPGSAADPWLETRLALFALVRLRDRASAEAALLDSGRPRFDWWAATWAAMRLEMPSLRPVLVAAASSADPLSRAFAARGLGAIKEPGDLDLLLRLLRDRDEGVVVNALRAVAALADPRGIAPVAMLVASPSVAVRSEALRALAALPPDRALRERIVAELAHPEAQVRAAALVALAHADPDGFLLVLSSADPDPSWFVRAALADAAARLGADFAGPLLLRMLEDEDVRVRPAVLAALVRARGKDAADTLRRHLGHPDVAVRAAAVEQLAALKTPGLGALLAPVYRAAAAEPELETRLAVIEALAGDAEPAARAVLREAAERDAARPVRERAARALSAQRQPAPPAGPELVARPPLDGRAAMLPYDPQPDVALFTPRAILHTRHGTIEIHLNVVEAPRTVASFLDLARRGFFDGLTFHRVVPHFVVQGGDPRGDGTGGPGHTVRCEIGQRPYGRGTVGMALSGKDTGGSQFFITHTPTPHLDGRYTVIGWVAEGMDVVDKITQGDVIRRVETWTGR